MIHLISVNRIAYNHFKISQVILTKGGLWHKKIGFAFALFRDKKILFYMNEDLSHLKLLIQAVVSKSVKDNILVREIKIYYLSKIE